MVNGAFADVGIHQWKEKLVGMGADGASGRLLGRRKVHLLFILKIRIYHLQSLLYFYHKFVILLS